MEVDSTSFVTVKEDIGMVCIVFYQSTKRNAELDSDTAVQTYVLWSKLDLYLRGPILVFIGVTLRSHHPPKRDLLTNEENVTVSTTSIS